MAKPAASASERENVFSDPATRCDQRATSVPRTHTHAHARLVTQPPWWREARHLRAVAYQQCTVASRAAPRLCFAPHPPPHPRHRPPDMLSDTAEDPGFSSSSPLTSPVDESDHSLAHPPELREQHSLPGLDGTPVRCECCTSGASVIDVCSDRLHGQGLM